MSGMPIGTVDVVSFGEGGENGDMERPPAPDLDLVVGEGAETVSEPPRKAEDDDGAAKSKGKGKANANAKAKANAKQKPDPKAKEKTRADAGPSSRKPPAVPGKAVSGRKVPIREPVRGVNNKNASDDSRKRRVPPQLSAGDTQKTGPPAALTAGACQSQGDAGKASKRRKLLPVEVSPAVEEPVEDGGGEKAGSSGEAGRDGTDDDFLSARDGTPSDDARDDKDKSYAQEDSGDEESVHTPPQKRYRAQAQRRSKTSYRDTDLTTTEDDLHARIEEYEKKLNKQDAIISAITRDKGYLQTAIDDKVANLTRQENLLKDANVQIAALKAEVLAAQGIRDAANQISNTTVPSKQMAIVRKAKSDAVSVHLLPAVQQRIHHLCIPGGSNMMDFVKAVVRQVDPEAHMMHEKRVHVWLPEPKELNVDRATGAGCRTAGRGCLPSGLVVESPMRGCNRKAMSGGLFGTYPGRRQDWLIYLARIVTKMPGSVVDDAGAFGAFTDDQLEGHCISYCADKASGTVRTGLNNRVDSQMTYRKDAAVKEFMTGMHFTFNTSNKRSVQDQEELEVIMSRVMGLEWGLDKKKNKKKSEGADDGIRDPSAAELLEPVKDRNNIGPVDLRRWRTEEYSNLCCEGHEYDPNADYSVDTTDILFHNFPARAAYARWTKLPPRGTRTRFSRYRCLEDLPVIEGDSSILELARLDAWMATAMIMALRPKEGDDERGDDAAPVAGASKNYFHNAMFEILLPRAIEGVLDQIRQTVEEERPDELFMPFSYSDVEAEAMNPDGTMNASAVDALPTSKIPCNSTEAVVGHGGDLHAQGWRKATSSHVTPYDKKPSEALHYVVATATFIAEHVCASIGDVRDGFVGVCGDGNEYVPITAPDRTSVDDEVNKSDFDESDEEKEHSEEEKDSGSEPLVEDSPRPRRKATTRATTKK